jgi:catechol 2,3-dioxygenase-like lactoylglutathione lyase family enzyme
VTVEVIGIDHVFVAIRDLEISGEFYDRVMGVLGFRKRATPLGETHTSTTTTATSHTR